MKTFSSEQSYKTPLIDLNPESGTFTIKGKSIPENSAVFYKPVFEWLDEYSQSPAKATSIDIQMDYFNTSSAKMIADIISVLEKLQATGKSEVTINWHYNDEDDDMLEAGEDFKSITKVAFNLVSFTK